MSSFAHFSPRLAPLKTNKTQLEANKISRLLITVPLIKLEQVPARTKLKAIILGLGLTHRNPVSLQELAMNLKVTSRNQVYPQLCVIPEGLTFTQIASRLELV
jgi:hypothetical protein